MHTLFCVFLKSAATHQTATFNLKMALKRRYNYFFKKEKPVGDEITYTLGKADEDSGVIHADNQYASCRDCFKCWLKNAGFCIMKGFSAAHWSAHRPE